MGWTVGDLETDREKIFFLFLTTSRPARGSTQPPIQWISRAHSCGWRGRGVRWPLTSSYYSRGWEWVAALHVLSLYMPSWYA